MRLLRDWTVTLPGQPRPVRFYWYGHSVSKAVKQKRFYVRIKNIETGEWVTELDPMDDQIPSPGFLTYWKRTGRKGDYFVYVR